MSEENASGWRPSAGDQIKGVVVDVAATDMGYGVYPIVTMRSEDGSETAVHAFHTVLRRELAKIAPQAGDDLDITYLGKKDGGNYGRGYDNYRVRSSKTPTGYDWNRDLPDAPDQSDIPIQPAPTPVDNGPIQREPEPSTGEKAAAAFGEEPPFLWEPSSWDSAKATSWSYF